jgi:hypothetical protein
MRAPTKITIETEDQQLYWQLSHFGMRMELLQVLGRPYHCIDTGFESKHDSFKSQIVLQEARLTTPETPIGSIQHSILDYSDEVVIAEAYRRLKLKEPPDPNETIDRIKLSINYSMSATDVARMLKEHPFLKETNK